MVRVFVKIVLITYIEAFFSEFDLLLHLYTIWNFFFYLKYTSWCKVIGALT